MGIKEWPNDGLPTMNSLDSSSPLPAEFERELTIEEQAQSLSATSRARFLKTIQAGTYSDVESQFLLLMFYRAVDDVARLQELERETGGPVVRYRGRLVPNPVVKMLNDRKRECERIFRLLGYDQMPVDQAQYGLF